jgi:hypothetical protein
MVWLKVVWFPQQIRIKISLPIFLMDLEEKFIECIKSVLLN